MGEVSRRHLPEQAGDSVPLVGAHEVCLTQPRAEAVMNASSSPSPVVMMAGRGGWQRGKRQKREDQVLYASSTVSPG